MNGLVRLCLYLSLSLSPSRPLSLSLSLSLDLVEVKLTENYIPGALLSEPLEAHTMRERERERRERGRGRGSQDVVLCCLLCLYNAFITNKQTTC